MHFKNFCFVLLAVAGSASADSVHQDTSLQKRDGVDPRLSSQVASLTKMFGSPTKLPNGPFKTPFVGLEPPPMNVVEAILTGVPPSALAALAVPTSRSALAAEFAAGHTPAWYQDLPSAAKSYIAAIKTQTAKGALTATTHFQPTGTAADAIDSRQPYKGYVNKGGNGGSGGASNPATRLSGFGTAAAGMVSFVALVVLL